MRSLHEHPSPLCLCSYGLRTVNTPHPVDEYKQTHENNVLDEKNPERVSIAVSSFKNYLVLSLFLTST